MRDPYGRPRDPGSGLGVPGARRDARLTYALMTVNVVVLIAMQLSGGSTNPDVLLAFGAMFGPRIADGEYWRLLTAMFLHVGFIHLAFNVFGLWVFGRIVEGVFGPLRFALIYVLAGLCGSVVSYLLNPVTIAAGASGAVFGIIGALAAYFAAQRHVLGQMAQQNLYGLLVLGAVNLIFGLLTPGIDNWAHLGGFGGGFALGYALAPEYRVVFSLMGRPMGFAERGGQLLRRLWVVPAAILLLALGIWAGNSTMPPNADTHVRNAERMIERGDFDSARDEIDEAIEVGLGPETALGRAYYIRAQIKASSGDPEGAVQDLARAVRLADEDTRSAAIALWARIVGGS